MPNAKTNYVVTITAEQVVALRPIMEAQNWVFEPLQYAHWRARRDKTTVVAYLSGKLVIQGKGTAEFVQFVLEPEVLLEARFGYEQDLRAVEQPDMFSAHAGIDESGKGDYFGPLVIAAAYVEEASARHLLEIGVTDSKLIKNDKRIAEIAEKIRLRLRGRYALVRIGPEAYNRTYRQIGNLNRLLAWGHARVLENLLEAVPSCPRAISDQFGRKETVQRALLAKGQQIVLEQRTKAESDVAVAAASILARDAFVSQLALLGQQVQQELPKGASTKVDQVATALAARGGTALLETVAKLHFKTTERALAAAAQL